MTELAATARHHADRLPPGELRAELERIFFDYATQLGARRRSAGKAPLEVVPSG
jgi:hypothetical protein